MATESADLELIKIIMTVTMILIMNLDHDSESELFYEIHTMYIFYFCLYYEIHK